MTHDICNLLQQAGLVCVQISCTDLARQSSIFLSTIELLAVMLVVSTSQGSFAAASIICSSVIVSLRVNLFSSAISEHHLHSVSEVQYSSMEHSSDKCLALSLILLDTKYL